MGGGGVHLILFNCHMLPWTWCIARWPQVVISAFQVHVLLSSWLYIFWISIIFLTEWRNEIYYDQGLKFLLLMPFFKNIPVLGHFPGGGWMRETYFIFLCIDLDMLLSSVVQTFRIRRASILTIFFISNIMVNIVPVWDLNIMVQDSWSVVGLPFLVVNYFILWRWSSSSSFFF